jgi:Domain of unknown function (DUF5597)
MWILESRAFESIEQVSLRSGQWKTERRLNGDQKNQGRQVLLDPHEPHIYRVRLYVGNQESGRLFANVVFRQA